MNNKKIITVGAILTAVIAVIGISVSTYASEGGLFGHRGFMNNDREAINEALDANDYEAWKELVGDKVEKNITSENFTRFVEAHELMQSGDKEGALEIFEELGVQKLRGDRGGMNREGNQDIRDAIENNDYDAFVEATIDKPISEQVTPENFAKFVEAHELMQSGDMEGAKEIFEELGIKGPREGKRGMYGSRFDKNGDGVCDRLDVNQE